MRQKILTRNGIGLYAGVETFADPWEDLDDLWESTETLMNILEDDSKEYSDDRVYVGLKEYIDSAKEALPSGTPEYAELTALAAELEMYNLTNKAHRAYDKINKYIEDSYAVSGDPSVLLPDEMEEKMSENVDAMKKASKKVENSILQDVLDKMNA